MNEFQSALAFVDVVLMQMRKLYLQGDPTANVLSLGSFVLYGIIQNP